MDRGGARFPGPRASAAAAAAAGSAGPRALLQASPAASSAPGASSGTSSDATAPSGAPTGILDLPQAPTLLILGRLGELPCVAAACLACRAFKDALYGSTEGAAALANAAQEGQVDHGKGQQQRQQQQQQQLRITWRPQQSVLRKAVQPDATSPLLRHVTHLVVEGNGGGMWQTGQAQPVDLYELAAALPNLRSLEARKVAFSMGAPTTRPSLRRLEALILHDAELRVEGRWHAPRRTRVSCEAFHALVPQLRELDVRGPACGWPVGVLLPQLHRLCVCADAVKDLLPPPPPLGDARLEASPHVQGFDSDSVEYLELLPPSAAAALTSLEHLTLRLVPHRCGGPLLLPPCLRTLLLTTDMPYDDDEDVDEYFDYACYDDYLDYFDHGRPLTLDMALYPRLRVTLEDTDRVGLAAVGPGAPFVGEEGGRGLPLKIVLEDDVDEYDEGGEYAGDNSTAGSSGYADSDDGYRDSEYSYGYARSD